MTLRCIIISFLLVAIGLLLLWSGGIAPLSLQEETTAAAKWQEDPASPPWLFSSSQAEGLPIDPLVELTVCPEGPPVCQFAKIQEAIDVAPFTPPIESWNPPPQIPLVRITPGLYEENVTVLKNVWLQGTDKEKVVLRGHIQETNLPFALFIAGSFGLGIGVENMTIEGGLQITGQVTGLIRNNRFFPEESLGISGLLLSGQLHLIVFRNSIVGGNAFNNGIAAVDVSRIPIDSDGGIAIPGEEGRFQESLVILENEVTGIRSRPRAPAAAAVFIAGARFVLVKGNQILANEGTGIELESSELVNIVENTVRGNTGFSGIGASESRGVIIQNDLIIGNAEHGVILRDGSYSIINSSISDNGGTGVDLFGEVPSLTQDYDVVGNIITRNEIGLKTGIDFEYLECRDNSITQNRKADYARGSEPSEELRTLCKGS